MAHQQLRRLVLLFEEPSRRDEVGHVGAEVRVGEVAVAFAQAREVEPQDAEARLGEGPRNADGGLEVLATGEAVREERERPWVPVSREFESGGEGLAQAAGKLLGKGCHCAARRGGRAWAHSLLSRSAS